MRHGCVSEEKAAPQTPTCRLRTRSRKSCSRRQRLSCGRAADLEGLLREPPPGLRARGPSLQSHYAPDHGALQSSAFKG